jgi:CubicO group peptidase (beta-lactamase class C family)
MTITRAEATAYWEANAEIWTQHARAGQDVYRDRTPAAADTPYPVASLTKTFAAAVIMRLVESGKLDLDEAMATYDPDYRHWCETIKDLLEARNYNCAAEWITVRHHLTHTAQGAARRGRHRAGILIAPCSAHAVTEVTVGRADLHRGWPETSKYR